MRADRILALLLLLQAQGRLTARRLAKELEVTERTIYRDVEALSTAGVPVYTERGPGGGISLLDDYRTNLTGLTRDEARALFTLSLSMLNVPSPLDELGLAQQLRAALRKLFASLPSTRQPGAQDIRQRVHLDWSMWNSPGSSSPPHLAVIQEALWEDRQLRLLYRSPFFEDWIEPQQYQVAPYGLVAKAGEWHLVCQLDDHLRVIHVPHILEAQALEETFTRPLEFNLAAFWENWCAEVADLRPSYPVTVRVGPAALSSLRRDFSQQYQALLDSASPPDEHGWRTLVLPFRSLETARPVLLGYGGSLEVLEPLPLRYSLADFAAQIARLYQPNSSSI